MVDSAIMFFIGIIENILEKRRYPGPE